MNEFVLPYSDIDQLREDVRFGYLGDAVSLIQKFKLTYPSKSLSRFSSALADAIQYRHVDILERLLIAGVPVTASAIRTAANKRCRKSLSMLLQFGWDINQPLSGDEPPVLCEVLDDPDFVAWMLEQGADPNAGCDIDETPLSCALGFAPRSTVDVLLKHVSSLDKGQLIYCAVERQPLDPELIQLLATAGAPCDDILWQDPKSFRLRGHFTRGTPLHNACRRKNVLAARILLQLGANPDKPSMRDNSHVPPTPRDIIREQNDPEMVFLFENMDNEAGTDRMI